MFLLLNNYHFNFCLRRYLLKIEMSFLAVILTGENQKDFFCHVAYWLGLWVLELTGGWEFDLVPILKLFTGRYLTVTKSIGEFNDLFKCMPYH